MITFHKRIFISILILGFFLVNVASAQIAYPPAGTRIDYPVGGSPSGVAFDNITNSVWVANYGADTVSKVDVVTGSRVDYAVGTGPYGVAFDNVTHSVWVANHDSSTLSKIDVVTGSRVDYATGTSPLFVAFDNVTNSVWVANYGADTVSKVDVVTGSRVDYAVGTGPYGVAFDNVTHSVWVANYGYNDGSTVSKVDIFTGTRVDYAVGRLPTGVAFDNATNSVWVANYISNTVSKVDIVTGTRVDYAVGRLPYSVTFDDVTHSIWTVNASSRTVSKIDIVTGVRVDYGVGMGPTGIAFDNITNSVWVANYSSGTVSKVAIGAPVITVQPSQFWSEIKNSSQGWLNLRKTFGAQNKPADDILKTVPNDWVLKVATTTDAAGNPVELDGYRWYGVVDATDGAVGWMAAKDVINSTVYLPYDASIQTSLEAKATTILYQTKESRTPVIIQAVDNYYTQTNATSSLYGGGGGYDGLNNFQRFIQGANFPKELVLAIAGHESAGTLDNEICASARDGGIGIMQITSEGFKGLGSALKNYPKMNDCRANIVSSKYYSNALQGIYASIKDGFRTLQEKYRKKCPTAQLTIGTLVYTCQDIERVLTTWAYNGKVLTGNYLSKISDSLRDLATVFPGVTYANSDQLIEKLKTANANRIEFKKFSPVEIEVVDSQGRITGFDGTPIIREEIPFSRYDREMDGGVVFFPQNPYTYRVIGTGTGTYGFRVEFTKDDVLRTFYATNIPITPGEIHGYLIDWDALDRGERGVTVRIDANGDGIIDRVVQSDGVLTEIVPPVVSVTSPSGEYLLNATTTVQFTATDASGIATTSATLNGGTVTNGQLITLTRPGMNAIEVSAMDSEGNTATTTSTFSVVYNVSGFLSPLDSDKKEMEAHRERVIPVKFKLLDVKGKAVSKAKANIYIAKVINGVVGADEVPASITDDGKYIGNQFRYDTEGKLYIFNLSTKTMTPGMWQIKAVLDSGQEIKAKVLIK